jgi:hypothetical protein
MGAVAATTANATTLHDAWKSDDETGRGLSSARGQRAGSAACIASCGLEEGKGSPPSRTPLCLTGVPLGTYRTLPASFVAILSPRWPIIRG